MLVKKYLRLFLINCAAIWLLAKILPGVSLSGGYQGLVAAAIALTVVNFAIKPLVNLLLLPINLITLGAFRWLINVLTLYLVTLVVPQLKIAAFLFPGYSHQGFIIPEIYLNIFWVFVLSSFIISLVTVFLVWLID